MLYQQTPGDKRQLKAPGIRPPNDGEANDQLTFARELYQTERQVKQGSPAERTEQQK